jgi:chemotaxis methyl-accepting protein methylase
MINSIEPYLTCFQTKHNRDISVYDDAFLQNIINDRQRELGLVTTREYLSYLESYAEEAAVFRSRLTNSYSEFFRNPITFAYLEQVILPQLIEKKKIRKENQLRIWSAACASGQEAYSLAILCDELIETKNAEINYLIFATDIDPDELVKARKGIYQSATLGKVTLKRAETYFSRKDENYSISPEIKRYIDFSLFDLLSDQRSCPPASIYGNFDLIFCSNLLFYYKPECRNQMLEKIGKSLSRGGYLITSETEREIIKGNNYREVFVNSAIFQKKMNT